MSELKNIHKGRRGVIIGAGWSLTETDLSPFKDDVIFACNVATTAINHCNYFCMSDGADPESNFFEHGCNISDKIIFFGDGFFIAPGVIKSWEKIKDKSIFLERLLDVCNFNFDNGKIIWGYDIGHCMANMAHVMGCSPLVLVGFDLNYKNHKKYCASSIGPVQWSETQGFGSKIFYSSLPDGDDDPNLKCSFETWKTIKTVNSTVQFFITNPQSKLNSVFPLFKKGVN